MKKNFLRMTLMSLFVGVSAFADAVDYPSYPTQTPVEGGKYVLANLAVPTGYMSRTSWDGAYYFLGATDSKYAEHAFTAHQNEEGLWFFTTSEATYEEEGEEPYTTYTYMGYPSGTDNLNGNLAEEAYFELLPGIHTGFYRIKAGEGQLNSMTIGLYLHMNAGGQYFVASEPTNYWYPDYYGGIIMEDDGVTPVTVVDDNGVEWDVPADSTNFNWAFVLTDDLPEFVLMGNAYNFLNNYEKSYCSIEGYAEGFNATLAAVMPLYKATDFTEGVYATLRAQVQAKIELYTQILKAEELDAKALAKAIAEAETAFKTFTDTDKVNEALAALTKACNDYSMGLGDITSMGRNMSFEDLSAQNGQTTTGVQPAPVGWNVYVNGELIEGAPTSYFANWHGVNADCAGYKDGEYGFGIWTPAVPEYEISQTITGLDNGTYTVTAGLMLDYRRTTQRIFGNLNSTLFSFEGSYADGILPAEYKTYGDQTECTDERTMQPVSVRAYVYDGTLTFGVKTNGDFTASLRDSGASGDGWFKVDNFTISKDGFIAEDQQNLYDYLNTTLQDLANQPMDANYKEQFDQTFDDKDEAIAAFAAMLPIAEAQAKAYEPLFEALGQALENAYACDEAGYAGTDDFYEFIDAVNGKYEDGAYTAEEIADVIASLEEAYQQCLRSGVDEGADVSDLIINRSFENQSSQGNVNSDNVVNPPLGWDIYINGVKCETADELRAQGITGWCAINSGDNINVEEYGNIYNHQYTEGTHLWGIWNPSIPQIQLSQVVKGLKPGTYVLTADVMVRNTDWTGVNLTTQRIFANDVVCLYGAENDYIPEYLKGTASDDVYQAYNLTVNEGRYLDEDEAYDYINYAGHDAYNNDLLLRTLELHFGVDESGEATIGFRTDNLDGWTGEARTETAAGWFKVDNFSLYYESSKVPTGIDTTVKVLEKSGNAMYDLSGRRVTKALKGIYIQNGKKVVR